MFNSTKFIVLQNDHPVGLPPFWHCFNLSMDSYFSMHNKLSDMIWIVLLSGSDQRAARPRACAKQQLAALVNPRNQSAKAVNTVLSVHGKLWAQSPQTRQLKALGLIQTKENPAERASCNTPQSLQTEPFNHTQHEARKPWRLFWGLAA